MPAKAGIQNWVPAFAGTSGSNGHALSPVFLAAPGTPSSLPRCGGAYLSPPPKSEGNGAPGGATISPDAWWRQRALRRRARHSALHGGDFRPRGRNFRARTGGLRPPRSGQLSPPFVHAASSHQRQSPVVGTDGDPGPPECVLARHARGRRACPTSRMPLEAPLIG
jgi:hypothetical protein